MQKALIIGNGIAGASLAWSLMDLGVEVSMMDAKDKDAASRIAAGLINPITGRRYVKSWMLETLHPFAKDFYKKIEEKTKVKLWYDCLILRMLSSTKEQNDWCARAGDADYTAWMGDIHRATEWSPYVKKCLGFGAVKGAARIDFPAFNQLIINKLEAKGRYIHKKVAYDEIEALSATYDCIIFCEGFRGQANPFFTQLPWQVVKGEAFIVELESAQDFSKALKKDIILVPISEKKLWVGANYEWNYPHTKPSAVGRDFLIEKLSTVLTVPYKILEHKAAVRPTNKKYRPFLGRHPHFKKLAIFNGLGTKGALLAPYWATHLAKHLVQDEILSVEVDWQAHRLK